MLIPKTGPKVKLPTRCSSAACLSDDRHLQNSITPPGRLSVTVPFWLTLFCGVVVVCTLENSNAYLLCENAVQRHKNEALNAKSKSTHLKVASIAGMAMATRPAPAGPGLYLTSTSSPFSPFSFSSVQHSPVLLQQCISRSSMPASDRQACKTEYPWLGLASTIQKAHR